MERLEDLAAWLSQLIEEEEFITKLLAEIDEQINCLQVEQMQLSSAMRDKEPQPRKNKMSSVVPSALKMPELDLTVPEVVRNYAEEEEDDEDDDDDL